MRAVRRSQRSKTPAIVVSALGAAALLGLAIVVTTSDPQIADVEISMVEMAFDPEEIVVGRGQDLHITNEGQLAHSLLIVGAGKGVELAPGQEMTLDLGRVQSGTYEVICDLPGHVEAGMVGTLHLG